MPKTERASYLKTRQFLAHLQRALQALPSDSEKTEIDSSLGRLMEFFDDLRRRIAALPTIENAREVSSAIEHLNEFLGRAEADPMLGALLGVRKPPGKRRSPDPARAAEAKRKAQAELARLRTYPFDRIQSELNDETRYAVGEIREIANELGIKSARRTGRVALAHQIAMKIANYRGYEMLRGGAPAVHERGPDEDG